MDQGEYTLNELTDLADVSTRTVRYYISEGLLPPPDSAGPRATYSQSHLDRLLLISQLKDAYLPLKEIRRRLDAMTDLEVRQALDIRQENVASDLTPTKSDDARAYLRQVMSQIKEGASPESEYDAVPIAASVPFLLDDALSNRGEHANAFIQRKQSGQTFAQIDEPGTSWRRIELGPDVELLIRDEAFERNRDRIEWLINWAKRVIR